MKKITKRILAVLLALTMTVCCGLTALAASSGQGGTPPEKPSGDSSSQGDGTPPDGTGGGGQAPGGGQSSSVDSYTAVKEYTEDGTYTDETINSTGTDENAVLVSDGTQVFSGANITRTSDDSSGGDNSSFYGVGAAVLGKGGTTYITKSNITTDSAGGAGVFAYSDGKVYVADTTINTTQDTSGGLHVAGGGTLYAWNVTATTQGNSSAAIRSDRGGGTMVVDGGTYTSNGTGSPAVYVTADVAIHDATLVANNSEGICLEGLNSLHLYNSDLTSNMPENEQNDCTWSVIVYQSMSGDSEEGEGTFQMDGGSITSKNGGIFYTTNTESDFVIRNVKITAADDCEFFLKCTGNSNQRGWGSSGSNGANCKFTAIQQEMNGDIIWDSISTLDLFMTDGSKLTGAILDDESNAGNGGDGYANVAIDQNSIWVVTGNSTVTNLYNSGKIVDAKGKTVTIQGKDGTVYVKGDSDYTVTVTGTYGEYADCTTEAGTLTSWTEYSVDRPSELGEAETTAEEEEESKDFPAWAKALIVGLSAVVIVAGTTAFVLNKKKKDTAAS